MREDLLHFIWKYKKFQTTNLVTTSQELVSIFAIGTHNHLSGPDFFNSKIEIDGQLWAGNVEIHINSSDWYAHGHEKDVNYNNVILHIVWEEDVAVFRKDSTQIPTLELKNYVSPRLLKAYQKLFDKEKNTFINCENTITEVNSFIIKNWLERLYFERLERKSTFVFELLEKSNNDWEQVLFVLLLKNFGLKINSTSFLSLANAVDFSIVRKLKGTILQLESLFFGMAQMLNDKTQVDAYYVKLLKEFNFLSHKYKLQNSEVIKPEYFKLRPSNFPTIRLSQLANLYAKRHNFFNEVISANSIEELYSIFEVTASSYWNDHYTFGKVSKKKTKKLTKKFIDLLIINTILPLKFCYAKYLGKDCNETILQISTQLKAEQNSITTNFEKLGLKSVSAKESQAILQLYNDYCTQNKCMECAIGNSILNGND